MKNESDLVKTIQLRATENGSRLFRNNVGMLHDQKGNIVRYGLFVGSGDLIGWTPIKITSEMVGKTIAVFTSIECKMKKGVVSDAQVIWNDMVKACGGISGIVRSQDDYFEVLRG